MAEDTRSGTGPSDNGQKARLRDRIGLPGKGIWLLLPVLLLLLLALLILVFGGFITVNGPSMENTMLSGDRVFVLRFVFGTRPRLNDIVTLKDPHGGPEGLIKRVIAVQGDTITCKDGSLLVNGKQPHEKAQCFRIQSKLVVPKDMVFVVGDNENNSIDSRMFGPVPISSVKSEAKLILWPLSRMRWL